MTTCSKCRFHAEPGPGAEIGTCRESPPVSLAVTDTNSVATYKPVRPITVWPKVLPTHWCGKWSAKAEAPVGTGMRALDLTPDQIGRLVPVQAPESDMDSQPRYRDMGNLVRDDRTPPFDPDRTTGED